MKQTTLMLPPAMRAQAIKLARQRRISFGELVRRALENELKSPVQNNHQEHDPLFDYSKVYRGKAPADLSTNHDMYLYDED